MFEETRLAAIEKAKEEEEARWLAEREAKAMLNGRMCGLPLVRAPGGVGLRCAAGLYSDAPVWLWQA